MIYDLSRCERHHRAIPISEALYLWRALHRKATSPARQMRLINAEEEAGIRELVVLETWPQGWNGDEPIATTIMDTVYANGAVQHRLFAERDSRT